MKIKIGTAYNNGAETDIEAVVEQNNSTIAIRGLEPFAGKPISFIPIPEGFKGKTLAYKLNSLAQIVQEEETTVYKMGSNPNIYYQYVNGKCHGYYDIEET